MQNDANPSESFIDSQEVVPRIQKYYDAGLNVCLVGPPGIGKTTLVHQLAGGRKNVRTAIGSQMHPSDLLGRMTLKSDSTIWQEGLLVQAARDGHTFYADELTGFSDECIRILHSVVDFRREVLVTANSQEIKVHPRFHFMASCNLSASGLDPLTREFRDRLTYVYIDRLKPDVESKLLVDRYSISLEDADWLVLFAEATRHADPNHGASTRQLEAAAQAIQAGASCYHAAVDCILSSIAGNSLSRRESLLNAIRAEGLELEGKWLQPIDHKDSLFLAEEQETWD